MEHLSHLTEHSLENTALDCLLSHDSNFLLSDRDECEVFLASDVVWA